MDRRQANSRRRLGRTRTLPQALPAQKTPLAQITYFPKKPKRLEELETRELRVEEQLTDPTPQREGPANGSRLDPHALGYIRAKVEKILRGDRRALEGLSSGQLAEVSVFGHQLYEDGRVNEARVVFEGLVAMDPAEAFPYTVLGAIFLSQHDVHRALALFEAALELDPDDVAALVYRGEIRVLQGNTERGRRDLLRAQQVDPDGPDGPFYRRARAALSGQAPPARR